jgi:hypothetical protein
MAEVRFKDFTLDAPEIKFAIAGENFDASPALSAVLLQQISDIVDVFTDSDDKTLSMIDKINKLIEFCDAILIGDSKERFAKIAPGLDLQRQIMPLLYWLLEAYGIRPTEVSSDSSATSPTETDGTTSTVGSSTEVTISTDSVPASSST